MAERRCDGCKYYELWPVKAQFAGWCALLSGPYSDEDFDDGLAYDNPQDGTMPLCGNHSSRLMVPPDFSCKHWKEKE